MNVKRLLRVLRDNVCYPVREHEHNVFDEPLSKKVLDTIYTDKPYQRKVIVRKFGGHNASDHCAVVVEK